MAVKLRVVKKGLETTIDLFEGNIKVDRKYWKKHHNAIARYFKLKEIK